MTTPGMTTTDPSNLTAQPAGPARPGRNREAVSLRPPPVQASSVANSAKSQKEADLARALQAILKEKIQDTATLEALDGKPMAEWHLATSGKLTETDILEACFQVAHLPPVEDQDMENLEAMPRVSRDFLIEHGCLPLAWSEQQTILAVYHPYKLGSLAQQWRVVFGQTPTFKLARRSLIEAALTNHYGEDKEIREQINWNADTSEQALKDLAHEAPVVRMVNDIFNRAVESEASDIHIEPAEAALIVRYRIDGLLHTALTPPLSYYAAIASRIKLIASMNIAERRLPQDGRIDLNLGGARIDVRVSTVPSTHGESIVLRLLKKDISLFDLDKLGLADQTLNRFSALLKRPYGMILVVGPTGSGKTTTLYGAMKILNSEQRKIITIEDPVEYQFEGLTQIQVKPQIGLTFANGLRSIVRQDPDIILVGEIRDRETAEIAIHAALTGHLVFSTLHTNDAAGAVSRLLEMGIEGFLVSSALLGVLSQRLVRKLCQHCQNPETLNQTSCRFCSDTGYRGRTGIFELLTVNEELRVAINQRCDSSEIARIARSAGMRTLLEDGRRKVREGITTETEVTRVCQLDAEE